MRFSIRLESNGFKLAEFPTGLGVSAAALAPNGTEIWMVDRVAGCITVLDLLQLRPTRSIQVGAEPHDIEFHPSGDRAWVSCSAAGTVDVISTASYEVVGSIPLPIRQPRGLAYSNGKLWVAPFLSGNGSTLRDRLDLLTERPVHLIFDSENPGPGETVVPLPDRDLLAIVPDPTDPALDAYDASQDVRGVGTILFDVFARPGTDELWIPNTEALNAKVVGERNFIAGQVVGNRVTVVDGTGGVEPIVIDLDELAPEGVRCAQPTAVAFHPELPEAYVAGYGSDVIAVLDLAGGTFGWKGHIELPRLDGERQGVRNLQVSGDELLAFSRGNVSLTRVSIEGGIAGVVLADDPFALLDDPTPAAVRRGRMEVTDADHSKSLTTSCASCHVDGHLDLLAWDLSNFMDPEGTPARDLEFEIDRKGPLLTQSLRDLSRTAPLHWRGEMPVLEGFNDSFVNLMEREVDGEPQALTEAALQDLVAYCESLAWPANPIEESDRSLTDDQLEGRDLFLNTPSTPTGTCFECHRGPVATSGELLKVEGPGIIPEGFVVPQLRGLYERHGPSHDLGLGEPPVSDLGFGISHDGLHPTLQSFSGNSPATTLTADQLDKVAEFLLAFDSGLAPSSARQFVIDPTTAASGTSAELDGLLEAAERGWCDVVVTSELIFLGGEFIPLALVYDVRRQLFQLAVEQLTFDVDALFAYASGANLELLVTGVPAGMGWRLALDVDADGLLDGDEVLLGTDGQNPDSDADGFSDGHEVRNGMDPLVADSVSLDTSPPQLLPGPDGVGPIVAAWSNTRTIQLEFATDEPTQARVFLEGGLEPLESSPRLGGFSTYHQIVVTDLPADQIHSFQVEITDEADFTVSTLHSASTGEQVISLASSVSSIELVPSADEVDITVTVLGRDGQLLLLPDQNVELFVYVQDADGELFVVEQSLLSALVDGISQATVDLPSIAGDPDTRTVFVGVRAIRRAVPTASAALYVEALDVINFAEASY